MDKRNWTYKLVVLESYLDQSFDWVEDADKNANLDLAMTGIHSGYTVAQDPAGPNLNLQISGPGKAHDKTGRRLYESDTTVLVDCEYDEYGIETAVTLASGKTRWIAVFVRFTTQYADAIVDGNGVSVYTKEYEDTEFFVRQGTEAIGATEVALQTEAILVCDVELTDGQTQILTADANLERREDWYRELVAILTNLGTQSFGTPLAAIDQAIRWIDALQVSAGVSFTGSATWHDTNAWTATDVGSALDEIVTELAEDTTNPGCDKIGSDNYVAGATFSLTRGSVWDQLKECADALEVACQSNADETITGQWDFEDFITIDCSGVAAVNATPITTTAKGSGPGGVFLGGGETAHGVAEERQGLIAKGGFTTTLAGLGAHLIGATPSASGNAANGLYGVGGDGIGADDAGDGALFHGGDAPGAGAGGRGITALGGNSAAGTDATGGHFTGGGTDGIGVQAIRSTNGSPLYISAGADPTTLVSTGCISMSAGGILRNYFGSDFRNVGCQAWGKISTDGAGAISVDGDLGITSAAINASAAVITLDETMSNTNYCVVATYVGASDYICRVTAQAVGTFDIEIFDDAGATKAIAGVAVEFNVAVFGA